MDSDVANVEANTSAPLARPSSLEWETIRPAFEDMYCNQNLPLREIEEKFYEQGFYATTRMFKTRIHNWHLDKNNKEEEMRAIIITARKYELQGISTSFWIRGKNVPLEKVYQYFERKGIKRTEWTNEEIERVPVPKSVRYETSLMAPQHWSHAVLERVEEEQNLTEAFGDFHRSHLLMPGSISPMYLNYISTSFSRSLERGHSVDNAMKIGPANEDHGITISLEACELAFLGTGSALESIRSLIAAEDADLVACFIESVAFGQSHGHERFISQLNLYFKRICAVTLGAHDPITRFAASLTPVNSIARHLFLELALQAMISSIATPLEPRRLAFMQTLLIGATIFKIRKNRLSAWKYLKKLKTMYDEVFGVESYCSCHCLVDLASLEVDLQVFSEAGHSIASVMRYSQIIKDTSERAEIQVRSLFCLAHLRKAEESGQEVLQILNLALKIVLEYLSDDHWMMRSVMALIATISQSAAE